jgi:hypothetical protein
MKRVLYSLTLVAGLFLASHAYAAPAAADQPDLSGTWKLNVEKSDFGQIPPPTSETNVITQSGADIKLATKSERDQGTREYTIALKIDGTVTPTPEGTFPPESPLQIISSKAEWDLKTLVITQQASFQGNPGSLKSKYTLSTDGKVLTRTTNVSMGMGDFTTTMIYDKQ